jgi:hypothetical protein
MSDFLENEELLFTNNTNNTNNTNHNGIIENDLAYSDQMYIPETLLIGWINLSAIITTCSLIFYDMARKGSVKVHPYLAKMISIGLIVVSTFYMIFSLIPYYNRMQYLASKCSKMEKCRDEQVEHINILKNTYLWFGSLTCIIQIIVTYLIIVTV